ncbi:MAG: zinc metallopeptidase [Kiritimatiellae bacterium]|nr:zinc metallopeptidase [Kiritimatiellia bacterium]
MMTGLMTGLDPLYWMLMLPAIGLALLASLLTKGTFARYSKVASSTRITGAQAAERLLRYGGAHDVRIERAQGFLSDHYDPRVRVLRLSPEVFDAPSLSAIGVACHEAGHALQHAEKYAPLALRSALVPVVQFGSSLSQWILVAGFLLMGAGSKLGATLVMAGIAMIALAVVFALVTLPVEWNASARAKRLMVDCGIVSADEATASGRVLNAAFMTYVAAAVSGIATLLYWLLRSGLLGGRRDD